MRRLLSDALNLIRRVYAVVPGEEGANRREIADFSPENMAPRAGFEPATPALGGRA